MSDQIKILEKLRYVGKDGRRSIIIYLFFLSLLKNRNKIIQFYFPMEQIHITLNEWNQETVQHFPYF